LRQRKASRPDPQPCLGPLQEISAKLLVSGPQAQQILTAC